MRCGKGIEISAAASISWTAVMTRWRTCRFGNSLGLCQTSTSKSMLDSPNLRQNARWRGVEDPLSRVGRGQENFGGQAEVGVVGDADLDRCTPTTVTHPVDDLTIEHGLVRNEDPLTLETLDHEGPCGDVDHPPREVTCRNLLADAQWPLRCNTMPAKTFSSVGWSATRRQRYHRCR